MIDSIQCIILGSWNGPSVRLDDSQPPMDGGHGDHVQCPKENDPNSCFVNAASGGESLENGVWYVHTL